MLERWGIRDRTAVVIFLSVIALVAITPLGSEGTRPAVLAIYRSLLFAIIIASALSSHAKHESPIHPYFLIGAAVVLAAMLASVLLRPVSHFEGLFIFYKDLLFFAAFIGVVQFNRSQPTTWKAAVLVSVVLINVVYVAATLAIGTRPLTGPFVNPNYFGSFLLAGLAVSVAAVLAGTNLIARIAAAAAGVFLCYGIGQTSSRGATLGAFAIFGVAALRTFRQRRVSWKIPLALAAVLLMTLAANTALLDKFRDRGERDPYNYQRPSIWLGALRMIADHPIAGVGIDQYRHLSKLYTPPVEGGLARFGRWPNIVHSEYLQQAVEIGIPGALLMFGLVGYSLVLGWRRARSVAQEEQVFYEAALFAAAGLGCHALVDNNFTVPVLAAGMAVISQANVLPDWGHPPRLKWTPLRLAVLGVLLVVVYAHSTVVPALAFYWSERGNLAQSAGDFVRAQRLQHLALAVVRDDPALLDNLGSLYFDWFKKTQDAEHLDRAESFFNRALAANPDFEQAGFHLEAVCIERLTGDVAKDRPVHAKIIETDRRILKTNPFNPFIRKNLAEALYNTGDRQGATQELFRAVEIEPNYVAAYFRLADWLGEAGQSEESARYREEGRQVVLRYQGKRTLDAFEALLLGRPQPN